MNVFKDAGLGAGALADQASARGHWQCPRLPLAKASAAAKKNVSISETGRTKKNDMFAFAVANFYTENPPFF